MAWIRSKREREMEVGGGKRWLAQICQLDHLSATSLD